MYTGLEARPVQGVEQVFGRNVACGGRCERAATDSAHARVEHMCARLEGGEGVRDAGTAAVVEMRANWDARCRPLSGPNELADLPRHGDTDRVR